MSLGASTRSEVTKQFTTSGWWILLLVLALYVGSTVGGLAAVFGLSATGALPESRGLPLPAEGIATTLYGMAGSVGYVFPLLIGTLLVTTEFRHRQLTPTFLATPQRGTVLTAKMLVGALMGLLYGAVTVGVAVGAGAGVLTLFGQPTSLMEQDTWIQLARIVLALVLWALIGIGVGSIVRNQVAAIVIVLAFTQFVEPIVRLAANFVEQLRTPVEYLPGAASDTLIGSSLLSLGGATTPATGDPMEWWMGAAILAAYALVLTLIGALTTWRRDVV